MIVKQDVECFVKWKEYNKEHDVWKKISKLENVINLIR